MKCPRCQHVFRATPDAGGIVTCPACSSRLRTRPTAAAAAAGPRPAPAPMAPVPATGPTLVKTSAVPAVAVPSAAPAAAAKPSPAPDPAPGFDAILDVLRALRDGQQEILELLRQPQAASPRSGPREIALEPFGSFSDEAPANVAAMRSRRRKTALLIDDDPEALAAAVDALERAEVPTRAVSNGNAGLAAIAEEKPDIIVMELGLQGAMAGKDVINMIKATMEWVDVPIVLYTRVPIESQREARQIHGADEYVLKGPGSPDALVVRVIAVFRKG